MVKPFYLILLLLPISSWSQLDFEIKRDSLLKIARNTSEQDTIRAEAYIRLSEVYFRFRLDSMPVICMEGVQLTNQKKDQSFAKATLTDQKGQLINNAGMAYYQQGELDKAVNLWYKSLEIKEELSDLKGQANVLNNIGNIEIDLGELDKSKATFKKILAIQTSILDSSGIARTYNTLGYIERINGNDSLALERYESALNIRKKLGHELGTAVGYTNVGFIHKKNQNYQLALKEYDQARTIYEKLEDGNGKCAVYNNIANCYYELGDYSTAKTFAEKGLTIAAQRQSLDNLMYLNEILYKINAATKNYETALHYHTEFITVRDTLNSKKNYKALVNQEMEYEFQKKEALAEFERTKEKELEALQYENQLRLTEEKSYRFKLISAVAGTALLIVLLSLYFIIRQLKITRTQKSIIEKQNKEIEMRALRSQMNPHFLFNSLNSIKHFIVKNEAVDAASYLTKFAKLIRLVLENSKHNLINLNEELDCLRYYLELERLRFNATFDFEINQPNDTFEIQLPPLLLQPFIENAIWHGILNKTDGNGFIQVNVDLDDKNAKIEIIDNGIGRKKAAEIAEKAQNTKKSMGLELTHKRLEVLNKVIGIKSSIEMDDLFDENGNATGTKVTITIPHHG